MELPEFMRTCEEAWQVFVTGDSRPAMALFSRREDVTLANPWGPAVTGWADVSKTLEAAAARFRDGRLSTFNLTKLIAPELACFHEMERGDARIGGRSELESFALRVTSVYRREDGDWRIVLRHADPIVTPRAADATLSA